MKITKTFLSVFLVTFLIGYVSVLPTKKTSAPNNLENVNLQTQTYYNSTEETSKPKDEDSFKPEIFGIIDVWELEDPKFKVKLMDISETGNNFQKEEIEAKSGETWLGLFNENSKYQLLNTKIEIHPERRPDFGRKNSITIGLNKKTEPVFLLKNAKKLKQGEVKTLYRRPSYDEAERLGIELKSMGRGFIQEFEFEGRKYTFRVKEGSTKSNEKILALVLEIEKTSQIIHFIYYHESGDYVGNLLWVGDIDHDGKLDLYMDEYNYEKGGFGSSLFLSSEAEKGKLVKIVASFGTSGC